MARKIKDPSNIKRKNFTKNIHSSQRSGTEFSGMPNHYGKFIKAESKLCCHDCAHYEFRCYRYIGKHHRPCREFKWW